MRVVHQSVFVLGLAGLITLPALAQERLPGADRTGIQRAPLPEVAFRGIVGGLLMNKSVQEELKLTAKQVKDVSAAVLKVREKYKDDLFSAKFGTLEPKERAELLATWDDENWKGVAKILKPEQAKRLKQIDLQQGGVRNFLREEVAKELKLTDVQKGQIKGIITEYLRDLSKEAGGLTMEAAQKLTKAAQHNIDEVLTGDQGKAWRELTGAPFQLTPNPGDVPPVGSQPGERAK